MKAKERINIIDVIVIVLQVILMIPTLMPLLLLSMVLPETWINKMIDIVPNFNKKAL